LDELALLDMTWRNLCREVASAKNRDLVLAVIAGCIAWFVVEVLRSVFG
jgi:hypothetical protein